MGRPWLGRLAGPGHSKGALGSAGLPGRQAASWTLCGLVTGHQGGQGGRGRGQGPETREMVVRAEGSGWALWPGAWLEPLGGQKESPALDRRRPGEDRRSPPGGTPTPTCPRDRKQMCGSARHLPRPSLNGSTCASSGLLQGNTMKLCRPQSLGRWHCHTCPSWASISEHQARMAPVRQVPGLSLPVLLLESPLPPCSAPEFPGATAPQALAPLGDTPSILGDPLVVWGPLTALTTEPHHRTLERLN